MSSKTTFTPVIGFEIHVELETNSKMFCGCPANHFGISPNTQTCPVCLGLPGALPVPNAKAIESVIQFGLALGCQISLNSKFDRKNYFYPDLPKGYQISQYDQPLCLSGSLTLASGQTIHITRVHLEEDTGKLQHLTVDGEKCTLVDFNRSGVPLMEIVTEPEFQDMDQALEFLKEIQLIIRALGISQADMEKGSMRLEANVSVKLPGQTDLPNYKVELKNINSFKFAKKAVEYDIDRQIQILKSGSRPAQETRGFNEKLEQTFSQRSKEEAHDYRYFPDPDIPPLIFTESYIDSLRLHLPQLPSAKRIQLHNWQIPQPIHETLISNSLYFSLLIQASQRSELQSHLPQIAQAMANKRLGDKPLSLESLSAYVQSLSDIPEVDPHDLSQAVSSVVSAHSQAVAEYKSGKLGVLGFLTGQVKKQLPHASAQLIQDSLKSHIDSLN